MAPAALLALALGACSGATATVELYVDPQTGDDAHTGATPQAALRSLGHAQQVVRQRRAAGEAGPVTVLLASGMYELPEGLRFDSPLDGGSAEGPTTWAAEDPEHPPRLVGGVRLSGHAALPWQPSRAHGQGVWEAQLPAGLRQGLASAVPLGAGRLQGEIVELQYTPTDRAANSSARGRLWRARHPNHDPTFPTIWGAGYLTASGGIGSLPCAFRSPRVTINTPEGSTVDCAIPAARSFPAEPPTGMTFDPAQLGGTGSPVSNWTTDRAIVHVSTYARPPGQGDSFSGGYAWVQNNLQYTVAAVHETEAAVEVAFELGGQQVNSYSWVLGAANIQNGSRWYMVATTVCTRLFSLGRVFSSTDGPVLRRMFPRPWTRRRSSGTTSARAKSSSARPPASATPRSSRTWSR